MIDVECVVLASSARGKYEDQIARNSTRRIRRLTCVGFKSEDTVLNPPLVCLVHWEPARSSQYVGTYPS